MSTCGTCRFAVKTQDLGMIECRIGPPTPVHFGGGKMAVMFAILPADAGWCCQHQPAPVKVPDGNPSA